MPTQEQIDEMIKNGIIKIPENDDHDKPVDDFNETFNKIFPVIPVHTPPSIQPHI